MSTKQHKDLTGTDLHIITVSGEDNPANLLFNGDFEDWNGGTAAVPDGWALTGGAPTIAREASIVKLGTYSAKVTVGGTADANLTQNVHAPRGIEYWKSRTVTLSCWVWCASASNARVVIQDGVSNQSSSFHTGDSSWQLLTVTALISASATQVAAVLYINNPTIVAYFDGAMLTEGTSIFSFADKSAAEGKWVDYKATSTIVGWTGAITGNIYVKKIGKTVFVSFYLTGTSDNAATTFILPYTSAVGATAIACGFTLDNGTATTTGGEIYLANNSATVSLYKDMGTTNNWTASGTKTCIGQFWYECA